MSNKNKRTARFTWFPDLFRMSAVEKSTLQQGTILPNKLLVLSWQQLHCWSYKKSFRGHSTSELMNYFCCPVHFKMKKGNTVLPIAILFLLSLASQVSWCVAGRITGVSAERHRLRPHLQVQEQLYGSMKDLEIQSPSRKLGLGHEVSTVELKHHRRITISHKGGSAGGGAAGGGSGGAGGGGRNVGGGGAVTRPHGSKNGAAALPVPVASVLVLAFACGVALSAFSF